MGDHLLPGERLGLRLEDLHAGDAVTWSHIPRGGWGYIVSVPATVVRVGKARVTIDAALSAGGTKRVTVKPSALVRRGGPRDAR